MHSSLFWFRQFFGFHISDLNFLTWKRLLNNPNLPNNLKIEHFSTHSLRKTLGRKIFELTSSLEQANLHSTNCQNSSIIPMPA